MCINWKYSKILNLRKVQETDKYLIKFQTFKKNILFFKLKKFKKNWKNLKIFFCNIAMKIL